MVGVWICKSYTGLEICHDMVQYVQIGGEYAWMSEFTIIEFWILQGSEYV